MKTSTAMTKDTAVQDGPSRAEEKSAKEAGEPLKTEEKPTGGTGEPVKTEEKPAKAEAKKKNTVSTIGTIIVVAVCAFIMYVCLRYRIRYVESGSMRPEYEIGAIVVVDPEAYDVALPKVGDIAMYRVGYRDVIHRIVAVNNTDPEPSYTFQGDNNDSEDWKAVPVTSIEGKAIWHTNLFAPIVRLFAHLDNV